MYHLYEYVWRYIHNLIQRTHNHFLHFADIHHYSMQVLFYPLLLNIVKKASQRANQRSHKSSHENARYKKIANGPQKKFDSIPITLLQQFVTSELLPLLSACVLSWTSKCALSFHSSFHFPLYRLPTHCPLSAYK